MAIRTQQMASFFNEQIVFSADYNDANGRVLGVRCVNNSPALTALATVSNRVGSSFSFEWAPQTTDFATVPAAFGALFDNPDTGETILAFDAMFGARL